jgi:hypothetical protein
LKEKEEEKDDDEERQTLEKRKGNKIVNLRRPG